MIVKAFSLKTRFNYSNKQFWRVLISSLKYLPLDTCRLPGSRKGRKLEPFPMSRVLDFRLFGALKDSLRISCFALHVSMTYIRGFCSA
jgi:hypothetical protein